MDNNEKPIYMVQINQIGKNTQWGGHIFCEGGCGWYLFGSNAKWQ